MQWLLIRLFAIVPCSICCASKCVLFHVWLLHLAVCSICVKLFPMIYCAKLNCFVFIDALGWFCKHFFLLFVRSFVRSVQFTVLCMQPPEQREHKNARFGIIGLCVERVFVFPFTQISDFTVNYGNLLFAQEEEMKRKRTKNFNESQSGY